MKVTVTNLSAAALKILGLGDGGIIPVGETRVFPINRALWEGVDPSMANPSETIQKLFAAGDLYYDLEPGKFDVGVYGVKNMRKSFAAGDFTDTDLSQTWDSDAFPTGARYAGARFSVDQLVTNSDADFASAWVDAGFDDDGDQLFDGVDVRTGTGSLGEVLVARKFSDAGSPAGAPVEVLVTDLVGMNIGGKKMRMTQANTGADANIAENTAGAFSYQVLYTIAP